MIHLEKDLELCLLSDVSIILDCMISYDDSMAFFSTIVLCYPSL